MSKAWEKWLTLRQTATELGVSTRKLRSMQTAGEIEFIAADDGSYRFDPAHVGEIKAELASDTEPEEMTPSKAQSATVAALVGALNAATDGMRQAHAHTEKMIALLHDPIRQELAGLQTMTDKQTAQIEQSFASRIAAFEQLEQSKSEQHVRTLLEESERSRTLRQQEMFDLLKKAAPFLVPGMLDTPKLKAAQELLESLRATPERLEVLMNFPGILSDSEKQKIMTILDLKEAPAPEPEPAPESSTTNGAAAHGK